MYRNGFVVNVRCKGKSYEGDTIRLPFDSEYEIFLKNKTDRDCVVDIYVDGKRIGKHELIIRAHSDFLLERFIGDSLSSGQRFKFVPLTSGGVSDKKNPENGVIEVRFYPARNYDWHTISKPDPLIIEKHIYHHEDRYYPYYRPYNPFWYYTNDNPNWSTTLLKDSGGGGTTTCTNSTINSTNHVMDSSPLENKCSSVLGVGHSYSVQEDPGATVGGDESRQTFGTANIDIDRSVVTVIKMKIVGYSDDLKYEELRDFCGKCGGKIFSDKDNFCRNCGEKLNRKGDI